MADIQYYCTNCGSILDDQYGFDPDLPAWKCTSCGQALCGDSIGSRFPGVVWFCDDCGAILSNQPGFSDEYDKWKCTECGYINEIEYCEHEDGEEYEIKEINHICPHCGSVLDDQYGFDEDKEIWKCSNCDTVLFGPNYTEDEDDYDGTIYRCEDCGEVLNIQDGFDENYDTWCCTECGNENRLSEEEYLCPNCGATLNDQYDFDEDKEIWKCSNCDTVLFGPNYTEDEDDYDGTIYRCEDCGEVLNIQNGFDEDYDTWCCTECGYENRLSEEEYLCPNCGATLNDQYGFDEDKEIWKCSNCDTVLFGPDYTEDEDDYDGTIYWCEECGEVLNVQDGFDEDYDTWCCTECGYENRLSEEEHLCPNCGAILNDQYGFDADKEIWKCSNCDSILFGPDYTEDEDDYDGTVYRCEECGKVLNVQDDFNEDNDIWYCTECGHENSLLHETPDEENAENDYVFTGYREYENFISNYDKLFSGESFLEKEQHNRNDCYSDVPADEPVRKSLFQKIAAFGSKLFGNSTTRRKILLELSTYECIGKDYRYVVNMLQDKGFFNIKCFPVYDLDYGFLYMENHISDIKIGGTQRFLANSQFSANAPIIIKYHCAKMVSPPLNYRNAKGKPYKDVYEKYINAGFGNIEMEPVYDLVLGLLKRNHSITKITINDIEKFSNKNVFRVDAVVKIQYHAFKKDRP